MGLEVEWKTKLFLCFKMEDIKFSKKEIRAKNLGLINAECKRVDGL